MARVGVVALVAALAGVLASGPGPERAAAQPPGCVGDTDASQVPQEPGPRIRFGINARAVTGQIGPAPAPAEPEDPERHLAKLNELRPPNTPFVLRLTRFFWRDGEQAFREFLRMVAHYTGHGYLVELQVRYQPSEEQEGDIEAWVAHVREVVRRFGPNRRVVGLQIANEVNIEFSPDSSDGAYKGAREALVQGVIAAKDESRRLGHDQLRIGFNWAYRLDPASETSFWRGLRDRGGEEFVNALDWIGLDAYPGTIFPPAHTDFEGYRDGMVNAMSAIRCYATIPGIPESVPIEIGENGWPTFPGRSYEDQERILRVMVRAAHDFRGTYNIRDYRWFNLRDSQTGHPGVFQNSGLLEDDYDEKPAFAAYRDLVARLALRDAAAPRPDDGDEADRDRRGREQRDGGRRRPGRGEARERTDRRDGAGVRTETAEASGTTGRSGLPFTGLALGGVALCGAGLALAGVGIRRIARGRRSAGP